MTSQRGAIRCPACQHIIIPTQVFTDRQHDSSIVAEITCKCGAALRIVGVMEYQAVVVEGGE